MNRPTVAVLFGANLNMLGKRSIDHYGTMTLDEVIAEIHSKASQLNIEVLIFQSNSEGALVDWVHEHRDNVQGYLVNPGGFTMFGQALRDSIVDTECPLIEVHWSNVHARKIESIWSATAVGEICGFGYRGAIVGLDILSDLIIHHDAEE